MSKRARLAALVAAAIGVPAIVFGVVSTSDLDERIPVEPGGSLVVDIELGGGISFDKGSLRVHSHPHDEVRIVADSSGWGQYAVDFDLDRDGDTIRLIGRVEGPLHWAFGGPTVDVEAFVPREFTVDARIDGGPLSLEDLVGPVVARVVGSEVTLSGAEGPVKVVSNEGPIDVEDVSGDLRIQTHAGSIVVTGLEGSLVAHSERGTIEVESATGRIVATTERGSIEMERVRGDVEARSDRGRVELEDVEGNVVAETRWGRIEIEEVDGAVHARSGRGGIAVEFAGNPAGSLETRRGSIEVEVPPRARFHLDARTERGRVHVEDLLLAGVSRLEGETDPDDAEDGDGDAWDGDDEFEHEHSDEDWHEAHRRRRADQLQASVNGGGSELRLRTGRGSIRVEDR
jgi:hypothetical protein